MKFDATIMPHDLNAIPDLARTLEAMGFAGVWTPETAHNPFLPLTLAAYATERLELGTAIAVAFPRSPMITAQLAWDLAVQSGGRFILGLGTQVKAHVRRRFSSEWSSPAARLREYVLALRAIWRAWQYNEPLDFRGEFYQHTLMTPFFSPGSIPHPDVPVYIAGVNKQLCQVAGEVCDGFHVHPFHTMDYLRQQIVPNIEAGAARAGRSRADLSLACAIFVVTGRDEREISEAAGAIRLQIAFYASTYSYRPVLAQHGWEAVGDELGGLARQGRWAEMADLISDEMLYEFAVVAPVDELAARVRARYDGLLDRVAYYFPFEPGERDAVWQNALATFTG
ncbi:MAG: TIGR03617 family F420-dependent LLM class oxidoreductase [Anaerolineae bacterium]|nr:TIGR03617 family F420-dependent LLM class oxidoreductase [Anaerolineae bacterium]